MVVGGFALPSAFVQLCEAIKRGEADYEWELRDRVDAYGDPYQNFGLILWTDPDLIAEETRDLDRTFREEDSLRQDEEERHQPGFIQDFTGVANFVRFGKSATGELYCFDFGADPAEPSVVTWTDLDGYWRRIAPNFEAFMHLFVPLGEGPDRSEDEPPQLTDELYAAIYTPRKLLGVWTRQYVLTDQAGLRPRFVDLAGYYAGSSPQERREVEAEVLEELERMGITDDHRRTHKELWARLRATQGSP
jgi:hypothetical protein